MHEFQSNQRVLNPIIASQPVDAITHEAIDPGIAQIATATNM